MADIDDIPDPRGGSGGRGKARGGRGSGGRSGGRGEQSRETLVSKALSKLLRHDAEKEGLVLDEEGFATVVDVLKYPRLKSLKVTFSDIHHAVTDNAKQRFALKPLPSLDPAPSPSVDADPSQWLIRANQGHSIALASSAHLTPITLAANNIPETVVHGTYYAFYQAILASGGLKPMSRTHVHFGTGVPGEDGAREVVSGMRNDAELLVYVDVQKALEEEEGMKWWVSENGVVLTEGDGQGVVPTRFWKLVRGKRSEVGVLWEDGRQVAELPQGLRIRVPQGKNHGEGRRGGGGRGGGRGARGGGGRGGKAREMDGMGGEAVED